MIIDLSSVCGSLENDYIEEYEKKSKIIIDRLLKYSNNEYILIFSINILNIIEVDSRFDSSDIYFEFITDDIFKVGSICGFECYVDIYMIHDEILISYKKDKIRDNKIDYLLNSENLLKQKRVKIIS